MQVSQAQGVLSEELRAWALGLWEHITQELVDENNGATQEIAPCGEHHISALRRDARLEGAPGRLDDLIAEAHQQMAQAHRLAQPTLCWRRLYTDACLLRSLADVLGQQASPDVAAVVARLDQAIIIAGPAGEGRLELIHAFIARLQAALPAPPGPCTLFSVDLAPARPLPTTFARPIPRLSAPPSLAAFLARHCTSPFVLQGFAREWPALSTRPWHSLAYLRAAAGPARVVPVEVGQDYRADDWSQEIISWDAFLGTLAQRAPERVLYLAQHDLFRQFPALRDDILVPDYAYAAPPPPADCPHYRPPPNEEQLVVNVWFGPGGTVSPAHTDPFFNLYTQVVGRKTVWLAPPSATPHMHAYAPGAAENGAETAPHNPAANTTAPLLSNTSRLDVFAESALLPPDFVAHVVPHALCATLEPGDVLFFPPGWWHAMRGEDTSFSVSMWF